MATGFEAGERGKSIRIRASGSRKPRVYTTKRLGKPLETFGPAKLRAQSLLGNAVEPSTHGRFRTEVGADSRPSRNWLGRPGQRNPLQHPSPVEQPVEGADQRHPLRRLEFSILQAFPDPLYLGRDESNVRDLALWLRRLRLAGCRFLGGKAIGTPRTMTSSGHCCGIFR